MCLEQEQQEHKCRLKNTNPKIKKKKKTNKHPFNTEFSSKSLIHIVRDCKIGCSQEIWVLLRATLFLGKWCGVAIYFLYKIIRVNEDKYNLGKYKIHYQNASLSLIE